MSNIDKLIKWAAAHDFQLVARQTSRIKVECAAGHQFWVRDRIRVHISCKTCGLQFGAYRYLIDTLDEVTGLRWQVHRNPAIKYIYEPASGLKVAIGAGRADILLAVFGPAHYGARLGAYLRRELKYKFAEYVARAKLLPSSQVSPERLELARKIAALELDAQETHELSAALDELDLYGPIPTRAEYDVWLGNAIESSGPE